MALVDPGAARQQVEPLPETAFDAVEAQGGQPRRGQFDGEGAAVEAPADLADAGPVGGGDGGTTGLAGPLEEQRHGVARVALARQRQPGDREHPLERQHEPRLRRGQDGHTRAPAEDPLHEHPDAVDQVLAVVEDEQRLAVGEVGEHVLLAGPPRRVGQAERAAHRRGDERLVGDRDQVDEPHAVAPAVGDGRGDSGGEAGLAHASGTERGHQPFGRHGLDEVGDLGGSPDERGERDGDRSPRRGRRAGAAVTAVVGGADVERAVAVVGAVERRVTGPGGGVGQASEGPPVGHVELAEQ